MVHLSHFPSEVLGLILSSKHSSFLVIDLWKSGNRLLQHKLTSCITIIDIEDLNFASNSRFPKLISCFPNLTTLRIDRGLGSLLDSSALLSYALRDLPSSLTNLSLVSSDAPFALLDYDSPGSVVSSASNRARSRLYDWSKVFPSLRSLEMVDLLNDTSLEPRDFLGLPRTLRHIDMSVPHRQILESYQYLPSSITTWGDNVPVLPWSFEISTCLSHLISLSIEDVDEDSFEGSSSWYIYLPKNLTRLSIDELPDIEVGFTLVAKLPRTLTYLRMFISADEDEFDSYDSDSEEEEEEKKSPSTKTKVSWPPALRTLVLHGLSPHIMYMLPQGIETLELICPLDKRGFFDSNIVPRSVTHLSILSPSLRAIGCGLPPTLLTLNAYVQKMNRPSCIYYADLPPSLTSLEVYGISCSPTSEFDRNDWWDDYEEDDNSEDFGVSSDDDGSSPSSSAMDISSEDESKCNDDLIGGSDDENERSAVPFIWPPYLTELTLRVLPRKCPALPATLKHFKLAVPADFDGFDEDDDDEMDIDMVDSSEDDNAELMVDREEEYDDMDEEGNSELEDVQRTMGVDFTPSPSWCDLKRLFQLLPSSLVSCSLLGHVPRITEADWGRRFTSLRTLNLSLESSSPSEIASTFLHLPTTLRHYTLSDLKGLKASNIRHYFEHPFPSHLKSINLVSCRGLVPRTFVPIAKSMPSIRFTVDDQDCLW